MKTKKSIESVEPQVAQKVNAWLSSYGLTCYQQHQSVNSEIDYALDKALSKSGGTGGNKPDAKLVISDSRLNVYPVMIEYKGYKERLEKLEGDRVANKKKDNTPNYNNINNYAVNGAVHYANAILQYTSFTKVIAIGVTGFLDSQNQLQLEIGVYYVGKENYGEARKVKEDAFTDLSFLRKKNFDKFSKFIDELSLDKAELRRIRQDRESQIEDALKQINESLFKKQENLSALSRIHLVAGSIIANLGVPGKVSPLTEKDLKSSEEKDKTDGDEILSKIKNFLTERKLPEEKVKTIVNSLYVTIHNEKLSKPREGISLIKEIFTEVVDKLGYFYKIGLDTDFTGKLFNTMFTWLSFAGDDQNDVVLTPWYVAKLMARLCKVNMDSYVWDFATGSAGLLVAAMHQMIEDAKANILSPDKLDVKIESIKKKQILGIEVLPEIYMLAVLNMILMGDGSSNILEKDSLKDYDGFYGYNYGRRRKKFPADVFLLNPPYSEKGNGMVFVEKALSMMSGGYAAVIIQDSAGVGQAVEYNKRILKKHKLIASIKMPKDLFRGKSSAQTSIYVFRVKERHEANFKVRFIDFSDDGYKRSARRNAKASKKLKDTGQAEARYDEVVNLVLNGASELRLLSPEDFREDVIALSGEHYGKDWNFNQHKQKYGASSNAATFGIVEDFQEWKMSQLHEERIKLEDYTGTLDKMQQDFLESGGKWKKVAVNELFQVDNTIAEKVLGNSNTLTPVVTNSSKNNGITKYVLAEPTEQGGVITFSDTTSTDTLFYQPHPFIGFSHVKKMTPILPDRWTENCCLFFISNLRHVIEGQFDWDHKLNIMPNIKVSMPYKSGELAFDYMEEYIKEVKRIHFLVLKDSTKHRIDKCEELTNYDRQTNADNG